MLMVFLSKIITDDDGVTIHSLAESSMLSRKIQVSRNLAYKIDEFRKRPDKDDIITYPWHNIIKNINPQ